MSDQLKHLDGLDLAAAAAAYESNLAGQHLPGCDDHGNCHCRSVMRDAALVLAARRAAIAERRCADCRFWDRDGKAQLYARDPRDHSSRRPCLRIIHVGQYEPSGSAPAVLTDGDDYAAALWTDPLFGCALFEPQTS